MKETHSSPDLRAIHKEFLESRYFSAFSIMTPKKDWLTIDRFDNNPLKIALNATNRGITNIVVCEGRNIKGFINARDLAEGHWNMMKEGIENFMFEGDILLPVLVDRMVRDSNNTELDQAPLYFVTQKGNRVKDIVGILTFWDLNRAPSYILFYSILVAIEQSLLLSIRKSHTKWSDHTQIVQEFETEVRNPRSHEAMVDFVQGPKYNFDKLDEWDLRALMVFYAHDPHVVKEEDESFQQLISILTSDLRNRVGHPVKFMIKNDESFKDDLKILSKILHYGEKFFERFPNPKVRHRSKP